MTGEGNDPIEDGYGLQIRADGIATGTQPSFVNASTQVVASAATSIVPVLPASRVPGNFVFVVVRANDSIGTGQFNIPISPPGAFWDQLTQTSSSYCEAQIYYVRCRWQ